MASTVRPISRTSAEKALASITEQFANVIAAYGGQYGPKLVEAWDDKNWAICWEEGAPYAWTTLAGCGGNDVEFGTEYPEAKNFPADTFAEPYDNCVLVLYRA
jgi:hypothetical protein